MSIETTEDIVEEILDRLGVYGAHEDSEEIPCRVCESSNLSTRLDNAYYIQELIRNSR